MPSSSQSGKSWITQTLRTIKSNTEIKNVLDIGAGCGTYYSFYNKLFPQAKWTAVEVWKDYITKYGLLSKYHLVINQNALDVDYQQLGDFDICFAGDVLEHVTKEESIVLLDKILDCSNYVVISIPIIYMPQGPAENNPHEVHVKDDWSHPEILQTFGHSIIDDFQDEEIGVYLLSKKRERVESYSRRSQQLKSLHLAKKKVEENPDFLYYWFNMARTAYMAQEWNECFYAAEKSRSLFKDLGEFSVLFYDFAALSAYNLGYRQIAVERGQTAVDLSNDERLKNNLAFYKANLTPPQ